MENFADRVINFNKNLTLDVDLPEGIRAMNPFRESLSALEASSAFYRKFYNDNNVRKLILGINPGRFGGGITGIPFTDSKRLIEKCGLNIEGVVSYEPSSVFIYEVIDAYGGVEKFYSDFYINSPSPLGFVKSNGKGSETNYNYYDSKVLLNTVSSFLVKSINDHINMGIDTKVAFCLGTGKNFKYLSDLNSTYRFFNKLIPLEHPRFIMQYKSRHKNIYIDKYIKALTAGS